MAIAIFAQDVRAWRARAPYHLQARVLSVDHDPVEHTTRCACEVVTVFRGDLPSGARFTLDINAYADDSPPGHWEVSLEDLQTGPLFEAFLERDADLILRPPPSQFAVIDAPTEQPTAPPPEAWRERPEPEPEAPRPWWRFW